MLLPGLFSSCGDQSLLSSCNAQASRCRDFSCCRTPALGHVGFRSAALQLQSTGSIAAVHRVSCSGACGIFRDQGSNACLLDWQADSLPPSHRGNPIGLLIDLISVLLYHREQGGLRRGREMRNSWSVEQSKHTQHLSIKCAVLYCMLHGTLKQFQ